MKYWLSLLLIINPITYISQINEAKEAAQEAYLAQDYQLALLKYQDLLADFKVDEAPIYANMAHAYFKLDLHDQAAVYYQKTLEKADASLQAIAYNQLGYIAYLEADFTQALSLFKQALLKDAHNQSARYNFELTKKTLLLNPEATSPVPKKLEENRSLGDSRPDEEKNASEKSPESPQEKTSDQGEKKATLGDQENLQPKKLEEIKLNREKAEAILEALKNQEIQYIQQLQRKQKNKNQRQAKQQKAW